MVYHFYWGIERIISHFFTVQEPPTFVGAEPKPVEAPKPVKVVEEEFPSPVSILGNSVRI